MLKVRFFKLKTKCSFQQLEEKILSASQNRQSKIFYLNGGQRDFSIKYTSIRTIATYHISPDGSEVRGAVETMEVKFVRFFKKQSGFYLSIVDPPRSPKLIEEILHSALSDESYFFEPLSLTQEVIDKHISTFDASTLVSAKIRDFAVYEGAVGRLEVTSKNGLRSDIAPFLSKKFYRVDSLTYEITNGFTQGLIYYSSNGTIRASAPIADSVMLSFEKTL